MHELPRGLIAGAEATRMVIASPAIYIPGLGMQAICSSLHTKDSHRREHWPEILQKIDGPKSLGMSPWNVDRNSDKLALVRRTSGPLNSMNRYLASGTKLAIQCLPNTVALILIAMGLGIYARQTGTGNYTCVWY